MQNLDLNQPITDEYGRPTPYFIQLIQSRGIGQDDTADALAVLEETVAGKADKAITITAGTGLDGGGDLSADRTISLSAALDDLTDVDTTTTAPTDGQALLYDTGDSLWKPGAVAGGGGGGSLSVLERVITSGSQAAITFSDLPTDGFASFKLNLVARSTNAGTSAPLLLVQLNGDTGTNYRGNRWNRFGSSSPTNTRMELGSVPGSGQPAGQFDPLVAEFLEPNSATFFKPCVAIGGGLDSSSYIFQNVVNWWNSTAAISSIKLFLSAGNFADGSVATLWGLSSG